MGGNNSCCEIRSDPHGSKLKNNVPVSDLQEELDKAEEDESKQGTSVLRYNQQEEEPENVKREEVSQNVEQEHAKVQTAEEFNRANTEASSATRESHIPTPPRKHASSSLPDKVIWGRTDSLIPAPRTPGSAGDFEKLC